MKQILVAVVGSSPAIITETLWALKNISKPAAAIEEVRILTTAQGRESIRKGLLDSGEWAACCDVCGYQTTLDLKIETLCDDGGDLEDIRTTDDNKLAADQIYRFIRDWTKEENTALHCSIAGGRKAMSAYLSNALMLCARPEDKAYHVLVSPEEFEKYQGFYYPFAGVVTLKDASGREHNRNASDANIELAEIYFVKLRELLSESMLDGLTTYDSIVERVQSYLQMLDGKAKISIRQAELDHTGYERIVVSIADCEFILSSLEGVLYCLLSMLELEHSAAIAAHQKEDEDLSVAMLPFINSSAIKRAYEYVTGLQFNLGRVQGSDFAELERWIEVADYANRVPLVDRLAPVRTRANSSLSWVPEQYKIGRRTYFIKVKPAQIQLPKK